MERKKVPTAKKMRRIKGAGTKRTTDETEERQRVLVGWEPKEGEI